MKITLRQIRDLDPCEDGLQTFIDVTGGTEDPVEVTRELIEDVGVDNALWVFARIAMPEQRDRFLIRRLDTGEHSALKTLRSLDGDFSMQITAVENVVSLLHRRLAGDDVEAEMRTAGHITYSAARAAADAAAHTAYAAVYTVHAAHAAAHAAIDAAAVYTVDAAVYTVHAAHAAADAAVHAAAHAAYAAAHAATHAAVIDDVLEALK